jgi:membrane protein implicated in regulation of membrane protease activity
MQKFINFIINIAAIGFIIAIILVAIGLAFSLFAVLLQIALFIFVIMAILWLIGFIYNKVTGKKAKTSFSKKTSQGAKVVEDLSKEE